jgi:hypothetical protein
MATEGRDGDRLAPCRSGTSRFRSFPHRIWLPWCTGSRSSSSFAAEHAMAAVGGSVQTDACVAQEGCVTGGTRQSTAPGPRTWCLQSSTCAIRPARLHPSPRPRCLFRSGRAGRDEQIRQGARLDRSPACEAGIAPCSNDACGHVTVDIWRDASRAGMAWLCAARRPGLTRHGKDVWASCPAEGLP